MMKRIFSIITLALCAIYGVLLIPDSEPQVHGAHGAGFVWRADRQWQALVARYDSLRAVDPQSLAPTLDSGITAVQYLLHVISAGNYAAGDSVYDHLESDLFALAPLAARCHDRLEGYARLMSRLRSVLKRQSEQWDMNDRATRERLYRLLFGGRFAVEEAMLQAPPDSLQAWTPGDDEPSATPDATLLGMTIHSGDILVSRGNAPTSALIARGNDFPGNFSHVALAYVDSASHRLSIIESVIEEGVHIVAVDDYVRDVKQRVMVLRLRADLPAMIADPMLPHHAAFALWKEARRRHILYDFPMDHHDHTTMYCSEVASAAYEHVGVKLWMGMSTISTPGVIDWLAALGVRNFELQEPSDLEYDPQLRVVAEWRDSARLAHSKLDDAVTEVMLDGAERGDRLNYDWYMLPVARIVKAFSSVMNLFDITSTIPEGLTATEALRTDGYRARHAAIESRALAAADSAERAEGRPAPYWEMLEIVRKAR